MKLDQTDGIVIAGQILQWFVICHPDGARLFAQIFNSQEEKRQTRIIIATTTAEENHVIVCSSKEFLSFPSFVWHREFGEKRRIDEKLGSCAGVLSIK